MRAHEQVVNAQGLLWPPLISLSAEIVLGSVSLSLHTCRSSGLLGLRRLSPYEPQACSLSHIHNPLRHMFSLTHTQMDTHSLPFPFQQIFTLFLICTHTHTHSHTHTCIVTHTHTAIIISSHFYLSLLDTSSLFLTHTHTHMYIWTHMLTPLFQTHIEVLALSSTQHTSQTPAHTHKKNPAYNILVHKKHDFGRDWSILYHSLNT